jgi:hypothetical protein
MDVIGLDVLNVEIFLKKVILIRIREFTEWQNYSATRRE